MSYENSGFLARGPMQPIARIGENILVRRVQNFVLYQIVFVEQVPPSRQMTRDFITSAVPVITSIAAAGSLLSQSLQNPCEMDGNELGQFRMRILDNIEINLWEPQNLPRFTLKQQRSRLTKSAQVHDPYHQNSEFYVFQQEFPFIDVFNNMSDLITSARISFYGFRYRINQVKSAPNVEAFATDRYTAVMGEGFAGIGWVQPGLPLNQG